MVMSHGLITIMVLNSTVLNFVRPSYKVKAMLTVFSTEKE